MPRMKRTHAPPAPSSPLPQPRMPDRPGRWKLIWRRQRKLMRPAALLSILFVGAISVTIVAHFVGNGPPLRERIGRTTAALGMRVADIIIDGRQKTPEPLLRAALGVSRGDAILGFSLADARARIETLTWVQSATVSRELPGTIRVRIVERRPFAVWQNQGKFALVDRAGEIVSDSDIAAFGNQLPLIVGPGAPRAAAALLDAIAQQPTIQSHIVAAVRIGDRRWDLHMTNGADVMLPEGADVAALAQLAALQAEHALLDRPLQIVDMRLPSRLVIRARADSTPSDKPSSSPPARKPT